MLDEQRASTEPSKDAGAAQDAGRLTYTLTEAASRLGISRALAYEAAQRGELPVCRIGRRVLVPRAALLRLLGQDGPSGSQLT
jgi:excisionase family DNA binding protein